MKTFTQLSTAAALALALLTPALAADAISGDVK